MTRRILCAWLANWPIQRLQAEKPELKGRPIVLWAEAAGRSCTPSGRIANATYGQRVVACSEEAAACGVRLHAPLANAACGPISLTSASNRKPISAKSAHDRRMAREGHCEEHRPADDLAALEKLAALCDRFSPTVGLEQVAENESPSALLLNVTGLVPLFQSEERLVAKLLAACRRWGYAPRVAVADTVGAAWAAAHFSAYTSTKRQRGRGEDFPSLGLRGGVIIPPGEGGIFRPLPVEALRLTPRTLALLGQLGITRIEQLLRLPRPSLAARFGEEVARRIDQLFGERDEPIVPHHRSPELAARWALEHPAAQAEILQQVLAQLLQRLAGKLAEGGQGAVELVYRLRGEDGRSIELPVYLFEPTAELPRLWNLFLSQWERRRLPGLIAEVAVEITAAAPLASRQYELFAGKRDNPQELAALVNCLSSRLGRERVVRPQLRPSAQPERAFRYLPLAGRSRSRETSGSSGTLTSSATAGQRPLRLLAPPVEIEVVAVQPAGGPAMLYYPKHRREVVNYWGPERIQTGWWRGRTVQRDYYRVETAAGERYWIFRRLDDGRWFLHGEFA